MKSTTLATAVVMALSLSTAAQAVHLDPGGRGQVLIYPYYTVNKHQQTLLSVTNTASVAQAVKVRFNEGYNGRMVRDLNVFLSPFDSWTGTIFALRDAGVDSDGAAVISSDTSCSAVKPLRLDGSLNGTPYFHFSDFAFLFDGGPYTIDRTREGYIEIYAMSDLAAPLSTAIAHGSNGSAPNGCAQVRNLAPDHVALSTPTGGLMGSVSIIDVAKGTYLTTRAEALAGFTGSSLFTAPENLLPNLAAVNDGVGLLRFQATARIFDENGKAQVLTYPGTSQDSRTVDAVSAVFMADQVYNEFQIAESVGAASDWVITLPTKPFYTDEQYTGGGAIAPFVIAYDGGQGGSPVSMSPKLYNRESRRVLQTQDPGWIPPPNYYPIHSLATVTNVVAVSPLTLEESIVLGSRLTASIAPRGIQPNPGAGWMQIALDAVLSEPHALLRSVEGKILRGLPVIGFWASNIVNNNVSNGVLANYAAAVRHATSVKCTNYPNATTPCN